RRCRHVREYTIASECGGPPPAVSGCFATAHFEGGWKPALKSLSCSAHFGRGKRQKAPYRVLVVGSHCGAEADAAIDTGSRGRWCCGGCRRLCGFHIHAWHTCRAGADDASRAGRFQHRGQDRCKPSCREESHRDFLSASAGCFRSTASPNI